MQLAIDFYFKNGTTIRSNYVEEKEISSDFLDILHDLFKKEVYTYHTFKFGGVVANVSELIAVKMIVAYEEMEDA